MASLLLADILARITDTREPSPESPGQIRTDSDNPGSSGAIPRPLVNTLHTVVPIGEALSGDSDQLGPLPEGYKLWEDIESIQILPTGFQDSDLLVNGLIPSHNPMTTLDIETSLIEPTSLPIAVDGYSLMDRPISERRRAHMVNNSDLTLPYYNT
jgi:hypothetical protein